MLVLICSFCIYLIPYQKQQWRVKKKFFCIILQSPSSILLTLGSRALFPAKPKAFKSESQNCFQIVQWHVCHFLAKKEEKSSSSGEEDSTVSMVVVELCRPNFLNSTFVLQSFTQLFFVIIKKLLWLMQQHDTKTEKGPLENQQANVWCF